MTLKYKPEILSALIEWAVGIFIEKGCGGINVISSKTGSVPPVNVKIVVA